MRKKSFGSCTCDHTDFQLGEKEHEIRNACLRETRDNYRDASEEAIARPSVRDSWREISRGKVKSREEKSEREGEI